jgi:hypothetical protein
MAVERLEDLRDALPGCHQRQHPLFQVGAVVARVAVGHLDHRGRPRVLLVLVARGGAGRPALRRRCQHLRRLQLLRQVQRILPVDRERGRIGRQTPHLDPKRPARSQRQPCKPASHVVRIQPVQRSSQTVIVEILGHDPWSQKMLHRLVREELGHEIEAAVTEAPPIEDHRHRRRPDTDLLPIPWLLLIQPVGYPDFVANSRHDPQMVEMLHPIL